MSARIPTLATLLLLLTLAPRPAAGEGAAAAELDEASVLAALAEHDPEAHAQLLRLKETSDASYRSRLELARGKMQLRADHPAWFTAEDRQREIEAQVDRKVAAYRAAEGEEREALYGELRELANRVQDCRMDAFRLRIALLELRLADLERQVQARAQERDRFVDRWLERRLERGR